MKTKSASFENMEMDVTDITDDAFLNKPAIKERIRHTTLQSNNTAFAWAAWEPEDEGSPITWKIKDTAVGESLVASTVKGVCFMGFPNGNRTFILADLQRRFPSSTLIEEDSEWQKEAFAYLDNPALNLPVHLHLKGTGFQLNIWKKLMLIPFGGLTTYKELGNGPRNGRATGSAVGANPVSYLLPCHRVVRSDGSYHRYFWGPEMKRKLLAYEAANV
jgi:AraC family transcriptional regulator of adaptative response/methylated-DNA-[protein]-cysteine methyltransferase